MTSAPFLLLATPAAIAFWVIGWRTPHRQPLGRMLAFLMSIACALFALGSYLETLETAPHTLGGGLVVIGYPAIIVMVVAWFVVPRRA